MTSRPLHHGFTLIELLIVVAIIAILAAIAVPNFLEAQTRAKVSRVRSDMRNSALALELYAVDNNGAIPQCHQFGIAGSEFGWDASSPARPAYNRAPILERLSTPVAYVATALIRDPFKLSSRQSAPTASELMASDPIPVPESDPAGRLNTYLYQSWGPSITNGWVNRAEINSVYKGRQWILHSAGPDNSYHNLGGIVAGEVSIDGPILMIYDASNGTVSLGSIYRAGGEEQPVHPNPFYASGKGLVAASRASR